jgi:hypothetical protein
MTFQRLLELLKLAQTLIKIEVYWASGSKVIFVLQK